MHSSQHAPRGRVAIPPLPVGMTDRALPEMRRRRESFSERAHETEFQIFLGSVRVLVIVRGWRDLKLAKIRT